MFHITAIFEDFQMTATSLEGHVYAVVLCDGPTGKCAVVQAPASVISHIMAFNLHSEGEPQPQTLEERYMEMEAWVKANDLPPELRPMA